MNRAIVLAHFDPDGTVDPYVIDALRRYRKVAARLVMVSASSQKPPEQVRSLVDTFVPRHNSGYDFCSWRMGIESLGSLDGFDELICVNDSVYGPTRDLAPVLKDPRIADSDAWGMCLSTQGVAIRDHAPSVHLQSWFIAMRRRVLQSEAFRLFWRSVEPLQTKAEVVARYEIGLSQCLQDAGLMLAGLYDARTAPALSWGELAPMVSVASPRRSLRMLRRTWKGADRHNPAELRPLRLLAEGVPYFKSSLFRVNHYRLDLDILEREIGAATGFDMDIVLRHQSRIRRPSLCESHDRLCDRRARNSATLFERLTRAAGSSGVSDGVPHEQEAPPS